jgi:hypothetical protein
MTPELFNTLVTVLCSALEGRPGITDVQQVTDADANGTLPEIVVMVGAVELALQVSPL